ncbi:hypothetical protein DWB64_17935 [Fusibacter sp. A1]|nr:hypothetical protein [Fusibacter sp. A1]RXV58846.1 hypothetical protein DWB64_17935 [Fusibacter sp. A1]
MENYDAIIAKFLAHLKEISQGMYSAAGSLEDLFDKEYHFRDVEIDGIIHEFYLRNPISYYLGADIWGLLYDKLERDEFFDMLKNPSGIYERLVGLLGM